MDVLENATLAWLNDHAHYGILTTDRQLTICQWNHWLEEASGLPSQQLVGRPLLEFFPHLVERGLDVAYRNALAGRVTILSQRLHAWLLPFPSPQRDGHLVQMQQSVRIAPLREGDAVVGTITVIEDVSERQARNRALVVAKEAAEAGSKAKAQFLANMSHEIRTPLNAIIGCANLLNDTRLDEDQSDFVSILHTSSESLLGLINDILDYSKIEAGRLELEEQPFSLESCVEEAIDLVAGRATQKGLELLYYIDAGVPDVLIGDQMRVRQILVNLLNNAVKFTEDGEVALVVEAQMQEDNTYQVQMGVRDTGIGISQEEVRRLFQPFTQADASTTRRYGGSGLGLVISRQLAAAMGGDIRLESEPGKGSHFHVKLNLKPSDVALEADTRPPIDLLAGHSLLIVDDNETNRWILSRQLRLWGIESVAVSSARAALAELTTNPDSYELCLLDVQMPEMDGIQLATKIHRLPGCETMPLMLLTSMDTSPQEIAHLRLVGHLNKPVRPVHLRLALNRFFSRTLPDAPRRTKSVPLFDTELGEKYPLQILLAEDNRVNQRVSLRILERLGYAADLAENGLVVLAALEAKQYDLILMDIQMPEMDGLAATQYIRANIPRPDQPHIVAMTAHALTEERKRIETADIDGYVSKPIDIHELAATLRRIHGQRAVG